MILYINIKNSKIYIYFIKTFSHILYSQDKTWKTVVGSIEVNKMGISIKGKEMVRKYILCTHLK